MGVHLVCGYLRYHSHSLVMTGSLPAQRAPLLAHWVLLFSSVTASLVSVVGGVGSHTQTTACIFVFLASVSPAK